MKTIEITRFFWVSVNEDRVVLWSPVQMAEYSVAEALTIANVLKAFVEQSAAEEIEELSRKVREAADRRALPRKVS